MAALVGFPHLGSTPFFFGAPYIDKPGFPPFGGMVVFGFGRGDALLVFIAIFVTEDSKVDVASFHFLQVDLVCAAVFGRKLLEEEHLGNKSAQDSIPEEEGFQIQPNLLKLLLDTADEYFQTGCGHLGHSFAAEVKCSTILLNSLSTLALKSASIW
jgi:hypothetical protein